MLYRARWRRTNPQSIAHYGVVAVLGYFVVAVLRLDFASGNPSDGTLGPEPFCEPLGTFPQHQSVARATPDLPHFEVKGLYAGLIEMNAQDAGPLLSNVKPALSFSRSGVPL